MISLNTPSQIIDRKFSTLAAKYFVSALGVGFIPKAPGTFGTVFGVALWIFLHYFSQKFSWPFLSLSFFALFLVSLAAGALLDRRCRSQDPQYFVMDEVLGVGIPLLLARLTPVNILLSFGLFRLFDIWKPYPIKLLDRLSHQGRSAWSRSFGIIADDLLAGCFAAFVILFIQSI